MACNTAAVASEGYHSREAFTSFSSHPLPTISSLSAACFSFSTSALRCSLSASHSLGILSPFHSKRKPFSPSSVSFFSFKQQRWQFCRAAEYEFPDPIPEFAEAETEKFRTHLLKKLSKKDIYGDSVEEVVEICTEIFSNFLHTEYGGPGTLLVMPFIDMADTLNEKGLPGGPQAARAAVVWAQGHVDKDWNSWAECEEHGSR